MTKRCGISHDLWEEKLVYCGFYAPGGLIYRCALEGGGGGGV